MLYKFPPLEVKHSQHKVETDDSRLYKTLQSRAADWTFLSQYKQSRNKIGAGWSYLL